MNTTPNIGLKKPEQTDFYNIDDFNFNADKIDEEIAKRMFNAGGVPSAQAGTDASKPTPGTAGRLYIATDTQIIYRDTGTAWVKVGVVNWNDIAGKPTSFTPSAHASTHASGGSDPITPAQIGAETPEGAQAKVDAHANRTDNPHAVTPAQIGAVAKTGDTMAGNLTVPNIFWGDRRTIRVTNFDTIEESGWYDGQGAVGAPNAYDWFFVMNITHSSSGGWNFQIAQNFYFDSETYIRVRRIDTGWSPWLKVWHAGNAGPFYKGTGSPEGIVTAPVGAIYQRTDGNAVSTLYVKEWGTGNTGWVAK